MSPHDPVAMATLGYDPASPYVTVFSEDANPAPWALPERSDELTEPTTRTVLGAVLDHLPRGAAWRSPGGAAFIERDDTGALSVMGGVLTAVAAAFADIYRIAARLPVESDPLSATALSVDAWERELALPDPCAPPSDVLRDRLDAIARHVLARGTITPLDVVRLSRAFGWEVAVEEPHYFECGASECGGWDEMTSEPDLGAWWVHVPVYNDYFECGVSECGDPLFEIGDFTGLRCVVERISPAFTTPYFVAPPATAA